MTEIRVASWNTETRLTKLPNTRRGTPASIADKIVDLDADIVFLPEAFNANETTADTTRQFEQYGYTIISCPYDEKDRSRKESLVAQPAMILMTRFAIKQWHVLRPDDSRNMLIAELKTPDGASLHVVGVHLDDRDEERRMKQVPDIIREVTRRDTPGIILGDFNAMHANTLPAQLLSHPPIKPIAESLGSIGKRAIKMARGTTMQALMEKTGYRDADDKRQPTTTPCMYGREWLPSIRLMQIDHILVSPDVNVKAFNVQKDGGADHRAIIATLEINS